MSAPSPSPASTTAAPQPLPPPHLTSPAPSYSTSPTPSQSPPPLSPSTLPPSLPPQLPVPESSSPPVSTPPENSPSAVAPLSSSPPPASIPPQTLPPSPLSSAPPSPPSISPPDSQSIPSPTFRLVPPPPSSQHVSENSSPGGSGGIGSGVAVPIGVIAGVLLLGLIGIAILCIRRQKKRVSEIGGCVLPSPHCLSPNSDSSILKTHSSAPLIQRGCGSDNVYTPSSGLGNSRPLFTYEELMKATGDFSTQNHLGEGGFGCVYKGYLPDGREVAVKQLKIEGVQGEREFKAEVEIISRIHHRHLVSLVGYCISDNRRMLVYDYVPNNTLYFHLHGEGRPVLDWANRVKIAAGAARGIAYLHEDCNPRIIHRDIKSSNILLDYNFEARVSDFGLAKLALDANTHVTTRVMGTFGYVAPEYVSSGKLTEKSDVYSFGVMLLELITGRKPVDISQPVGEESLVEWARPLLSHALDKGGFESLTDPKLGKNYVESEIFCMIEVAAACVQYSSTKRPRMGQVVRAFDSLSSTCDLTNGMRVGESEAFYSGQQSAEIRLFQRMAFGNQDYYSSEFFSQISLNT